MGRSSGYIAAHATIANGSVDLCLIPEVPIILNDKDPRSCLKHLEQVLEAKGHAVVVVAEGAGEELLAAFDTHEKDAGGNKKLLPIGQFLVNEITKHFKNIGRDATVKYIDPSYTVRSVPAAADDSIYCQILAAGAVHGAMAGFTAFSVGMVNNHSVLIPIQTLVENSPRVIDKFGRTWDRVLRVTGQPNTVEKEDKKKNRESAAH
jgi:6-phosphofructokinase 1